MIVKRILLILDAVIIVVSFVAYLRGVKDAAGLLGLLNLINIPIILKFNKMNKSEENRIMGKREVFLIFNTFALVLIFGLVTEVTNNLFTLFLILVIINICVFFCYSILNKKNQKV